MKLEKEIKGIDKKLEAAEKFIEKEKKLSIKDIEEGFVEMQKKYLKMNVKIAAFDKVSLKLEEDKQTINGIELLLNGFNLQDGSYGYTLNDYNKIKECKGQMENLKFFHCKKVLTKLVIFEATILKKFKERVGPTKVLAVKGSKKPVEAVKEASIVEEEEVKEVQEEAIVNELDIKEEIAMKVEAIEDKFVFTVTFVELMFLQSNAKHLRYFIRRERIELDEQTQSALESSYQFYCKLTKEVNDH